jgi:class 3 adenylate cyclase
MRRIAGEKTEAAVPMPTGTVTFLFTDVEGSTQRWDSYPEAMRSAVERHDDIVRREIEANRGYVFKTVGDAFCAAFEDSRDAIAAAVAVQRELAAHDFSSVGGLCVRMGLHRGEAVTISDPR